MKSLTRLLNPQSIAFIGGNECAIAIRRTLELGFTGKIYAVHPKRDELSGIPTLKTPEDIPEPVDAAFIAVKNIPTIDVVRTLCTRGCGGAVIYAAGFAETGNSDLQRQLLEAANGMPLMGPNCYGFVNTLSRAALWPDETGLEPVPRGVAVITQTWWKHFPPIHASRPSASMSRACRMSPPSPAPRHSPASAACPSWCSRRAGPNRVRKWR
jgi:acyl-CoA synthetase (NDP forming)